MGYFDAKDLSGVSAAMYLRKSRAEEDMETEEVLAKHRQILTEFAIRSGLHIAAEYPEVVSGSSLAQRPQMLQLLDDIEDGKYDAILCVDIDRLSRGNMKDQGIILDTLKYSDTIIVTPEKTYDLSNEIDEEMTEYKTFMARQEYKMINRRLRRGLVETIKSGGYVSNAPYGYRRITISRKPTLEIIEHEAHFVRMMFDMYCDGIGAYTIANHINSLGARPHRSDAFNRSTVRKILSNPTYAGKVVWNQRRHIKKGVRGSEKNVVKYNAPEDWLVYDGLHPAIISQEQFEKAAEIIQRRYIPPRYDGVLQTPTSGLIICGNCGRKMQRLGKHQGVPYLHCMQAGCNTAAKYEFVESFMLRILREELKTIESASASNSPPSTSTQEYALSTSKNELATAERQKTRCYELLEQGIYSTAEFHERFGVIKDRISGLNKSISTLTAEVDSAKSVDKRKLAAKIRNVLEQYDSCEPPEQNAMLRDIIDRIIYVKAKKSKPTDFSMTIIYRPF